MDEEERYQKALALYECLGCMNACDDKIIIVKKLAKEFKELGDYKEAGNYAAICKKAISKTKKEKIQFAYEQAILHLKRAQSLDGYQKVLKEFEELGEYEDSEKYKAECKKKINEICIKENRKFKLGIAVVVLILLAFVALHTTPGRYYKANVYMKIGMYEHAGKLYDSLDGYKDSEVRYHECEYQVGVKAKHKKDYAKAKKAFEKANGRKDSNNLLVQVQKKLLEEKEIGDKIKIGDSTWIVVSKQEDKVQLLKKSAIKNVVYSKAGKNNWKDSDARAWLNGEYLESVFTKEENANIVTTSYTVNGEEITDKLSILTGYPVDSNQFSIRPLFWYSLQ